MGPPIPSVRLQTARTPAATARLAHGNPDRPGRPRAHANHASSCGKFPAHLGIVGALFGIVACRNSKSPARRGIFPLRRRKFASARGINALPSSRFPPPEGKFPVRAGKFAPRRSNTAYQHGAPERHRGSAPARRPRHDGIDRQRDRLPRGQARHLANPWQLCWLNQRNGRFAPGRSAADDPEPSFAGSISTLQSGLSLARKGASLPCDSRKDFHSDKLPVLVEVQIQIWACVFQKAR